MLWTVSVGRKVLYFYFNIITCFMNFKNIKMPSFAVPTLRESDKDVHSQNTLFIVNDAYHPERAFEKLLWKLRRSTWSIKTIDMERPFPSAGRSQLICPGPVSSCCCCKKDYPLTYLHFFTNVIQQICGALSPVFHDNCCCVSHSGGSYRERRTRGIYCNYTI